MTKTQEYLLGLLKEIDELCKKNDIEYFIDYGTALGAVRHKGFIPWDDDIDIMLTEENYAKFVEACERDLDKSKRMYVDNRLDREFPTVFGRYNDLESARPGQRSEFWKPICGQCIDVFTLLELPGDPKKKQKAIDLYFAYDEYSNSSYCHVRMKTEPWMKLYRRFKFFEKFVGKERVLRHIEKKIFNRHYDDCDTYICTSARKKGPSSIVPKACYDTAYLADFDGLKVNIPGDYMQLLTTYYEDSWCMLPDHKKHHSQMSHTGIGCKDYVADYMRLLDKDTILKERQECKDAAVKEGYLRTRWINKSYKMLGLKIKKKIELRLKNENVKLSDYMDAKSPEKLAKLDDIFSEYFATQMNASVRYWEVFLDISDEYLDAAMYVLAFYRNDFYSIAKILYLRKMENDRLTKIQKELENLLLDLRQVKAHIEYKEYDSAKKLCDELKGNYSECREVLCMDLLIKMRVATSENDIKNVIEKAEELLKKYADDDTCIFCLGMMKWELGNKDEANKYFDWILEKSNNGMLHMYVNEKRGEVA